MPRLQIRRSGGEEVRHGVQVVDIHDSAGHGDDDLGRAGSDGMRLPRQGDSHGLAGRVVQVVNMQAAVP